MKYIIFISLAFSASCSIIPSLGLVEGEIEKEINTELKVGADAIQQHNSAK